MTALTLSQALDFLSWRAAWFAMHAAESRENGKTIDAKMYQFVANELTELGKELNAHGMIMEEFGTQWDSATAGGAPASASDPTDWNVLQFSHRLPGAERLGIPGAYLRFSMDRSELLSKIGFAASEEFDASSAKEWHLQDVMKSASATTQLNAIAEASIEKI